jgi:hypothetical protein
MCNIGTVKLEFLQGILLKGLKLKLEGEKDFCTKLPLESCNNDFPSAWRDERDLITLKVVSEGDMPT